ncbi:MAG: sensor histidine kinase [Phocaeicola sp.]
MVKMAGDQAVSDKILNAVLENIHAYVLLITEDLQVLMTNYYDLTHSTQNLEFQRVGDLLKCKNALAVEGGCGTSDLCPICPIRSKIKEAFSQKDSFAGFESSMSIVKSDEVSIDCDVTLSGKYIVMEEVPMVVLTIHDVTEMKKVQQELELARLRADESNKSKSLFLANMNHEIRTPLNAIVGFSELLAYADSEEEKEQYLETLRVNNKLLQQLIADILDIAKIEAGTLEFIYSDVDLNHLLFDVQQSMLMRLGSKRDVIELLLDIPEISCSQFSDQNRLMQVLSNFVTNSIKFTDNGTITMGYKLLDDEYYFYVTDTGHGISADKLPSIFDRFMRIEKEKQGAGLGLAICKTIIDKLEGKIGVESELSVGSTFWFTLPR